MQDFKAEIRAIDAEIKDLTWAGGLFKFDYFRKASDEPDPYVEIVKSALVENDMSEQQKIIMVLMLQKLPFEKYIDFCEVLFNMLEKKQITHNIFKWALFPGYEWNTSLAENFRVKRVRSLMGKLLESDNIEEAQKRYVREDILTGRAKKQVQFLRDIGQIK